MAPSVPNGPQDATPDQQVAQEALVEEDEIQAMEQDAPIPEVASRMRPCQII